MSVSEQDFTAIEQWLKAGECTTYSFKQRFPGLMFSRLEPCDVRDETPARVYAPYRIFLVDGREHCWRLTTDPANATGIVLVRDEKR